MIEACVRTHGTTLFKGEAASHRRYFHLPGDPPFECFQVVIEPPSASRIEVWAFAIDTNDDTEEEMEQSWEGPVENLSGLLASAIDTIEIWKGRKRNKPDPPSPW